MVDQSITSVMVSIVGGQPRGLVVSKTDLTSRVVLELGGSSEYQQKTAMQAVTDALRIGVDGLMVEEYRSGSVPRHAVALTERYASREALRGVLLGDVAQALDLGSSMDRGNALEVPIRGLLRSEGFRLGPISDRYPEIRDSVFDALVWLGDSPAVGVECKNYRALMCDILDIDEQQRCAIAADHGLVILYVVPVATARFKRLVRRFGGVVVETGVYVVDDEAKKVRLERIGTPWPVAAVIAPSAADGGGWPLLPESVNARVLDALTTAGALSERKTCAVGRSAGEQSAKQRGRRPSRRRSAGRRRTGVVALAERLFAHSDPRTCVACGLRIVRVPGFSRCIWRNCSLYGVNQLQLPPKQIVVARALGIHRDTLRSHFRKAGAAMPVSRGRPAGEIAEIPRVQDSYVDGLLEELVG